MELFDLIKKYPDVSPDILKQYKSAEKTITFNDHYGDKDPDLDPTTITLPEPPEYHKIANFGLPAKEQKFRTPELPDKLRRLVDKTDTLDSIWEAMELNQFYYKDEIAFIKRQWYYFLNGYWVFINGIPTFINGWQWFYCSWWKIDIGLPYYKSRDRKFYLFAHHCYTTTEATYRFRIKHGNKWLYFSDKKPAWERANELGIVEIEEGWYILDKKKRTVIGFTYAKYRREGATYKACCILYCMAIIKKNGLFAIQSLNDEHAEGVFSVHIVDPWQKLPFFFKPNYEGSTNPKKMGLSFSPPGIRQSNKGSLAKVNAGLNTKIIFAKASGDGVDGKKVDGHEHDEVAKFEPPLNMPLISQRIKPCFTLDQGQTIVGFGIKTSTVGDTAPNGGGDLFKNYCNNSMYYDRNANGHTLTGFVNLFIPTSDGVVVDEFGNSVIDDPLPNEEIYDRDGVRILEGGRSKIMNERKHYLDKGDFEGLALVKRESPEYYAEAFSSSPGLSKLPLGIVDRRLEQLTFKNDKKNPCTLDWTNGFGSDVEMRRDELGKWFESGGILSNEWNKRYWDNQLKSWIPKFKFKRTLGIDPFKSNQTKGSRRSEGAGAVVYKHDFAVDPSTDLTTWKESQRFTMTYSFREFDKEVFFEDMLKTAIFQSCGVFPEMNLPEIWDWFVKKGYGEYMLFKFDPNTGKESVTPGATLANNTYKEQIFAWYSTYLTRHCMNECHDELLKQIRRIQGPKQMTDYDLFSAGGWAGVGSEFFNDDFGDTENDTNPLDDFFKPRKV
jgi:hypothetical protein